MIRPTVFLFLFLFAFVVAPLWGQDLLIRGGRVLTMAGDPLPVGDVLIEGGRVRSVGVDLAVPLGVTVLDARGKVVMPGFVLAHTTGGLERPNELIPVTPYVSVVDSIDPSMPFFEDSLRDGHLTLCVMPGDAQAIGGMGRVVRPFGLTVEAMTVDPEPGLKLSMIPRGVNRSTHLDRLRQVFDGARRHLETKQAASEKDPVGSLVLDLEAIGVEERQENVIRILEGDLPAFVTCDTAADVVQALRLAEEYKISVRLVCRPGTWRAAPLLAARKIPVILGPEMVVTEKDPETGKDVERVIPRIFHEAGVKFAMVSDTGSFGGRYLWYQAACLVRYGMSRDAALAAVTKIPAELIGLGSQKGVLAEGFDGDVLVLTDDPLSGRAWVDQAVMQGRVVYRRSRDPRLAELFGQGTK